MKSLVRCFRRPREEGRCGVWVMTQGLPGEESAAWGVFFHGEREEIQAPRYDLATLEKLCSGDPSWFEVEEINPDQALAELESWAEAQAELRKVLDKWPA